MNEQEREKIKIEIYDAKFKTYGWKKNTSEWVLINVVQRAAGGDMTLDDAAKIVTSLIEAMEIPINLGEADIQIDDKRDPKRAAEVEFAAIKKDPSSPLLH